MHINGMIGRAVLGAGVVGSLALGASTALAAPGRAAVRSTCTPSSCIAECEARGYDFGLCRWIDGAYYCRCENRKR